ncbi:MAG TPA: glycosyltransferase [Pyrinomonadaceae bacterium]|nr:glycosyltransferase [Pyrinomonadaceae bacterium]
MSLIKLVVIMSGFPRRSETFAVNELLALARRDMLAAIIPTKPGDYDDLQPGVESLLPFLPRTVGRTLATVTVGGPHAQPGNAELTTFAINYLRHQPISGVHAYFAHQPAEIAERIAAHLGVPFSFSVHAKDARKVNTDELTRRARRAACVIACNVDIDASIRSQTALIPHGVDLNRFQVKPQPSPQPLQLLAVGRLVEKKGFHFLLEAASSFQFDFHLRIYGEGPERARLAKIIATRGLQQQAELCGPTTHAELPAAYSAAHVVVVPSVIDEYGDRDGLPNVILEAMACGRPVVASDVGAISVAVRNGRTGVLVPPADAASLTRALADLSHPSYREKLGRAAREHVEQNYDVNDCAERFCQLLEETYALVQPGLSVSTSDFVTAT